ncbi:MULTISPECIES: TetR/AcrR family transcriptional regulator [Ureibacillus]|jgi:AcrR family transcriptional regulator|uniref:AcrR family transcriptional regulator n=1 Tax=Ureibacillus thermosphaericus TaxID=51173 RepID=A0A840PXR9_URETH|nr:TetR/AcrR family transcriptional regulator [Ureibacillus thermosphaericus]MBB5150124.1 AcrR family transcriptional regulator [Ureibacillus thermosphaericus]NKZ32719.1 TetR/AcrR family transcriptional regulator [Ureibacillus thermosphaericus]
MKKSVKERILETSLHLFQEHGYHGVTVDKIVLEAGTSKGGFYHNYKSKDELLYEIHDVFISYVIEKAELSYTENKTPISRLSAILNSFIKVFDMYKPYITVFYEESAYLNHEFKQVINEKRDRYRKLLEKVIVEGQESGDFRNELPANIVTMAIIGMINWTYKWFKQDGPMTMEEITAIFKDLILRSIVTEQGLVEAKQLNQLIE